VVVAGRAAFCCFVLDCSVCHGMPVLGYFGPLLLHFFDPLGFKKYLLIACLELAKSKYAKMLEIGKNRHNRRNRDINCIIKPITP